MSEQRTCGQGLAESSVLPAKLGDVIEAMAEVLEVHMEALALEDNDSRREHEAYRELVKDHRQIANSLHRTARQMAGYRTLPMGRHIPEKIAGPQARDAFDQFVKLERELVQLVQERVETDRKMLQEMGGSG